MYYNVWAMVEKRPISLYLDPVLYKALAAFADKDKRSINNAAIFILAKFFEDQKK